MTQMLRIILIGICALTLTPFSWANSAQSELTLDSNLDFAAPAVNSTSDVSNKVLGQIVYEVSTGLLKVYSATAGGSATWTQLSPASGTNPVTSGSNLRVETFSMTTTCTAGPTCSAGNYTQSGSWVSSVTYSSTGNYILNITAGVFTSAPTCTGNVRDAGSSVVAFSSTATSTAVPVYTLVSTNNTYINTTFNVVCVGPR